MSLVPHIEDKQRKEILKDIRKDMNDGNADKLLGEHNVHIGVNAKKAQEDRDKGNAPDLAKTGGSKK